MTTKKVLTFFALPALLMLVGQGCVGGNRGPALVPVELSYWRVHDDEDAFRDIIEAYTTMHPNVEIEYRELRPDEYDTELVRAIAEGRGPDIFSVHNTRIGEFLSLMEPLPSSVNVTYLETRGTLRKETIAVNREEPTITERRLREDFVDVVATDVIRSYQPDPELDVEERIFALPLAVDTLTLFYNKDLLDVADIAEPPVTWEAFTAAVRAITVYDTAGGIAQSAAALGTTENVERSADIISLLMMQNGVAMTDDRGNIAFQTVPVGTPRGIFPSVDAVTFYTDFANPIKDTYTWNEAFDGSFQAFASGQTAFFLGYSYHIPLLRAAAPRLDYGIATAPQVGGDARKINYANYWVEAVSKSSEAKDYAWDFVEFATSAAEVSSYLNEARKPTALRELINTQVNDEQLGPFVEQVLTAESWYRGNDARAMETAMNSIAEEILAGTEDPVELIENAARVVGQTYRED